MRDRGASSLLCAVDVSAPGSKEAGARAMGAGGSLAEVAARPPTGKARPAAYCGQTPPERCPHSLNVVTKSRVNMRNDRDQLTCSYC